MSFSPRNGGIVIKVEKMSKVIDLVMFQSPIWGYKGGRKTYLI